MSTWTLFFLMWLSFAWILVSTKLDPDDSKHIRVHAPTFQQNCSSKRVPCVNDCSFLCVEKEAECVGGVCRVDRPEMACEEKTGGLKMMVHDPLPHWTCLCTHPSFYGGEACDVLNPDVCENGAFMYANRDNYYCFCLKPYKRIIINGKPHCVEEAVARFVDPQQQAVP